MPRCTAATPRVGERGPQRVDEAAPETQALQLGQQVDVQVRRVVGEFGDAHALGIEAGVDQFGLGECRVAAGRRSDRRMPRANPGVHSRFHHSMKAARVGNTEHVAEHPVAVGDDERELGRVLDVGQREHLGHERVVGVDARRVAASCCGEQADAGDGVAVGSPVGRIRISGVATLTLART